MNFMYPLKPNRITIDFPLFEECSKDPNFILQIKKNGWRVEIHKEGDDVIFYTRHKKRMEKIVDDADWEMLRNEVRKIDAESCIIDGEFMHRRGERKNTIFMWDLFLLDGKHYKKPYEERIAKLREIVTPGPNFIILDDYVDNFREVWDALDDIEENEGIVIKDKREKLRVLYAKPSSDKSPKQFKILLKDKRNESA